MKSRGLFDPTDDFQPNPKITEPVVWVRRMAVLEHWQSESEPVFDIELRRGLNIIATATPRKVERDRVGHDVGKTLLTRLIRYCLGEAQYGRKSVREALHRELPDGYVVAEVFVDSENWIVARPLTSEPRPASWSWTGMNWDDVLILDKGQPYSRFIDRLTDVTSARCEQVKLPGRKRSIAWLDMLAWLTRDQHCAYRDPLEWRTKWSDTGSGELDLEDASLAVRLSMDLVNEEEGRLIEERKKALQKKAQSIEELASKRAGATQSRSFVVDRMSAQAELFDGPLFAEAARKSLNEEIGQLKSKLAGIPETTGLAGAEAETRTADRALRDIQSKLELRRDDLTTAETEARQHREAESTEAFSDLNGCPLSESKCPFHLETSAGTSRRDYRKEMAEEKAALVSRLDREIGGLIDGEDAATKRLDKLKIQEQSVRASADEKMRPIQRRIALLEAVRQEAKAHDDLLTECDTLERRIKSLDKKIEQLRERQREIAIQNSNKLRRLNKSIAYVLHFILGKDADNVIRIGIHRLTFATDDDQSSPGEGMATSATLSLDLACLRASLMGLGFLPRFLVHDSPRGGDLEQHLYARMFELIVELESHYDGSPPFQYILATTTQPPKELLKPPYLRLTLDGRKPELHLLKRRF